MKFDKSYTDYWKDRVTSLSDGTKIADEDILNAYLPLLDVRENDVLLDIGCSYGRFFPVLSRYSSNISGLDVDPAAIEQCRSLGYKTLSVCAAEQMDIASESIDKAVCWATFDCVEQEDGLREMNRVLKPKGRIIITGKNIRYHKEDNIAFIAERNAYLKNFPNHFTDISKLSDHLHHYGFKMITLNCYEYRGDFGQNRIAEGIPQEFYEYLIVLEKTEIAGNDNISFCERFSAGAVQMAIENNFSDPGEFFKWHKSKFPEG